MSLKSFHIIFLIISTLFATFFSYWCYAEWQITGNIVFLIYFSIGLILWISLLIYGKWFMKKIATLNV